MTQDQIEAVRMNLRRSFEAWAEPLDKLAGEALDHLTKANEELRAEVERLQTTIKAFNNGMPAMTTKEVADENADLRATIDRLTHDLTVTGERYHAVIKERDGAVRSAGVVDRELERQHTRLSAMQEAIDEAVRRAEHSHAQVPAGMSLRQYWTEPLRPFATKPEQFDPLVATGQALLRELQWVNDQLDLMPDDYADALEAFRTALAARNHTEGRTDG